MNGPVEFPPELPDVPNPVLVMDALEAHRRSAALKGAIDLDLFSIIGQGQKTVADISRACQADERAIRILCDFLVIQGFLKKQGNEYRLTATASAFLNKSSPNYLGGIARFINSDHLLDAFRDVATLVRKGRTLLKDSGTISDEYEGWVDFARCMGPMMVPAAEFLGGLAAKQFHGPIKVLDIAAGHGLFGIGVAKGVPQARIVALDWGKVLEVARENAGAAGISNRYELLAGDALTLEYGSGFDLVLVTNFFHHFDKPTCESIMRKIHDCLNPGGRVFTLEFVPNEDRVTPPSAAGFSFTMLATTPKGDAYTFGEYSGMFQSAGLQTLEMLDVPYTPMRVIVCARQ